MDITIGDYTFRLLSRRNDDLYNIVTIKNVTVDYDFDVYASNSEMCTYRYASLVKTKFGVQYHKGLNYVTTTCIDFELQKFIVKNFDQLPVNDIVNNIKLALTKMPKLDDKAPVSIKNFLDDRLHTDDNLNFLTEYNSTCGFTFSSFRNVLGMIKNMYDAANKNSMNVSDDIQRLFLDKCNEIILDIIRRWESHYKKPIPETTDDNKLKFMYEKYDEYPYISNKMRHNDKFIICKHYINLVSEYFNLIFDIDETSRRL
jgi:hypothetical protein